MAVSKGNSELRLPYDETPDTGETWVLLFMTRLELYMGNHSALGQVQDQEKIEVDRLTRFG